MRRDFSENSKRNLLNLVSQVENEKWSDFTDWFGDRWYDFQSLIGKLKIKNYIDNVNEYHKKVIDKNNATKTTLEKIFTEVNAVDVQYSSRLSSSKSTLQEMQRYIHALNELVSPVNARFNVDSINSELIALLSEMTFDDMPTQPDNVIKETDEVGIIKDVLRFESGFSKLISKVFKNHKSADEIRLSSSIFSYFSSLYTFYTTDYADESELASISMKLTNASTNMFGGIYNFIEGNLSPLEASRFGKKFQGKVKCISLIGDFLGFTGINIETAKVFFDENSTWYEKFHGIVNSTDSGLDLTNSIVNYQYGQKILSRTVTAKYQYGVPIQNVKALDKCNTGVALASVLLGFIDGAVMEHQEVSADGIVDSNDRAKIGVNGSVKGLTEIADFFTAGIFDISDNADEISDGIVTFTETKGAEFVRNHDYSSRYVENAQFLMDIANDENRNFIERGAAEVTAGLGMIGAVTVDCVGDGLKWMGNELEREWNSIKNYFS